MQLEMIIHIVKNLPNAEKVKYEACLESNDTKVLNMYSIFNLQKRHCEWIACT